MLLRHFVLRIGNRLLCNSFWGKERLADGTTSFLRRIALADGGHAAGSKGTLGKLAVPILAVRSVAAAAPALRKRAVRAAVVVISGLVPHEAFKGLMIAIREIHRIPPFGSGIGLAVYIEKIRFMVKRICRF